MKTSGCTKICIYFVEGDDDEDAVRQWCGLHPMTVLPSGKCSRAVNDAERWIVGRYPRIRKMAKCRSVVPKVRKYVECVDGCRGGLRYVLVAQFAQQMNKRAVVERVRLGSRFAAAAGLSVTVILDCDKPWEHCVVEFNSCIGKLSCCRTQRGEGRLLDCGDFKIFAVVERLEDVKGALCNCVCCN